MLPVSESPCVVTILAPPGDDTVWIRLVGAVEMGAEPGLDGAIDRVRKLAPRRVRIDLAGVTFAGSVFVHFLARLHAAAPGASVCVRHAAPVVRFVMTATGVDKLVTLNCHRSSRAGRRR
jgi:anti-anti-sigma regulatory factor